jgi:hypothetical protein
MAMLWIYPKNMNLILKDLTFLTTVSNLISYKELFEYLNLWNFQLKTVFKERHIEKLNK